MTQMIARRWPEEGNVTDDCPKRGLLNNPGESRLRLEGRSDDGPENGRERMKKRALNSLRIES